MEASMTMEENNNELPAEDLPPQPFWYVIYDEDGNLIGCYLQLLQLAHEDNYIPVWEGFAYVWLNYRANAARDGVELIAPAAEPGDSPREGV